MTPPQAQPVSIERPLAGTATAAPAGAEGPFVINLRSSTTPMALSQPNDPALTRFKFFMSRRLEDGRERFRLHMGFFETLAEAEEWLSAVREIYPGAWAGEAPGKRLKARAPESAASASAGIAGAGAAGSSAAGSSATGRAATSSSAHATSAAAGSAAKPVTAPAATSRPTAAEARIRADSRAVDSRPVAAVPPSASIPPNVPVLRPAQTPIPAAPPAPRSPSRTNALQPSTKTVASAKTPASSKQQARAAALPLSNVREVLAALDETGATRQMPALPATKPAAAAQASAPTEPDRSLSDTQVLKLLESRRADGSAAEVDRGISLLKPDDTGTRHALREAIATNAAVSFAVQLQWSVQAIDISKVPPLAIFSAYTLYTVEGSREGRRWYGLRLGFFSDAISAKQVAHYVRSEFNSVAVVPVSPQERTRASEGKSAAAAAPRAARVLLRDRLPEQTAEIRLIDDEPVQLSAPGAPRAAAPAAGQGAVMPKPPAAAVTARPTTASPAARAVGSQAAAKPKSAGAASGPKRPRTPAGRVRARDRRAPQTLEETLEILGADQLEIDQGRGETLNDTGVRHLKVEVRKNSPFTRLLDRLSERARGR